MRVRHGIGVRRVTDDAVREHSKSIRDQRPRGRACGYSKYLKTGRPLPGEQNCPEYDAPVVAWLSQGGEWKVRDETARACKQERVQRGKPPQKASLRPLGVLKALAVACFRAMVGLLLVFVAVSATSPPPPPLPPLHLQPGMALALSIAEVRNALLASASGAVSLFLPEGSHFQLGGVPLAVAFDVTLTSTGSGAVLDGESSSRVANVGSGAHLEMVNVHAINGNANRGGCIDLSGRASL